MALFKPKNKNLKLEKTISNGTTNALAIEAKFSEIFKGSKHSDIIELKAKKYDGYFPFKKDDRSFNSQNSDCFNRSKSTENLTMSTENGMSNYYKLKRSKSAPDLAMFDGFKNKFDVRVEQLSQFQRKDIANSV